MIDFDLSTDGIEKVQGRIRDICWYKHKCVDHISLVIAEMLWSDSFIRVSLRDSVKGHGGGSEITCGWQDAGKAKGLGRHR